MNKRTIKKIKKVLSEATDREVLDNWYLDRKTACASQSRLSDFIYDIIKGDKRYKNEYWDELYAHPYWELLYDEAKKRYEQIKERSIEAVEAATTDELIEVRTKYSEYDNFDLFHRCEDVYLWYIYDGYESSSFFCTFRDMIDDELISRGIDVDELDY